MTDANPADEYTRLRLAAMNLLARREQSVRELQQKLLRRSTDTGLINSVIETLAAEGLQSDQRFAESFLRQRVARGYGPKRLLPELRQRGVADDVAEQTLAELEVDWYTVARDVFHARFGEQVSSEIKEKARRDRFMQYRGFSSDHYRHLI